MEPIRVVRAVSRRCVLGFGGVFDRGRRPYQM